MRTKLALNLAFLSVAVLGLAALIGCNGAQASLGLSPSQYSRPVPGSDEQAPPPINVVYNFVTGVPVTYLATGTTPLIVGWGNPDEPMEVAGLVTVTASSEDSNVWLTITYDADPGWQFGATHVWVGDNEASVPKNIPPGQATSITPEPGSTLTQQTHRINLTTLGLNLSPNSAGIVQLFVAAHAEMNTDVGALASFEFRLPTDPVPITLKQPSLLGAYLDAQVTGAGTFDGTYRAWCVDPSRRVPYDQSLRMTLVSSYSTDLPLLEQLVGTYQNLDLLNLLLNTDWATALLPALAAKLDALDMQVAIWKLIDLDELRWASGTVFDADVVDAILAYLSSYRAQIGYFEPGEGDVMAVIADPNNLDPAGTMQVVILELPVTGSSTREETAWGYGKPAPGKNWAMYFEFHYQP